MDKIITLKNYRIDLCINNINYLLLKCKFNKTKVDINSSDIINIYSSLYNLYLSKNYIYNYTNETTSYTTDTIDAIIREKDIVNKNNLIDGMVMCHSLLTPKELPINEYKKTLYKFKGRR